MAPSPAEGDNYGESLSAATSTTDPLLVVETHRRHVCEHHGSKTSDVDPHFHRGRDTEDVDDINRVDEYLAILCRNHDVPEKTLLVIGVQNGPTSASNSDPPGFWCTPI
jgi:hypothetical protein